ncbi:hypothetical protein Tco_1096537 [Tanacetum coccineum]|uniref:Uncharacterized protein n=1 Tax=Tanacetum coccineum TaxID=301880 RepID=A0ABQ4Y1Z2_9ASTR
MRNSPPKDGTRKSQPLFEGKPINPKDLEGNKQPAVLGLPSTPEGGTRKSKPSPKGKPTYPKYSKGNMHPTDMGLPANNPDEVGYSAPIQLLRDFEFLMEDSKDDLKELGDEDFFLAGDDMETDWPHNTKSYSQPPSSTDKVNPSNEHHSPPHPESRPTSHHEEPTSTEHPSPTPDEYQHESSKSKRSKKQKSKQLESSLESYDSESSSASLSFKIMINICLLLKWFWQEIFKDSLKAHKNTDTSLKNYKKILLAFKEEHLKGINTILTKLHTVQEDVKEVPTLNYKELEATDAYIKNPY